MRYHYEQQTPPGNPGNGESTMKTFPILLLSSTLLVQVNQVTAQALYEYGFIEYKPNAIGQLDLEILVGYLHSDGIRGNAIAAANELVNRKVERKIPLLEEALQSHDWQQRQMAAELLRRTDEYPPTDRLIEVTVEGLRDDEFPVDDQGYTIFLFNAYFGTRYLIKHPNEGTKYLEDSLESDDAQQRFLAAYILASTERGEDKQKIAEILLPHLHDDNIPGNAIMSVYALYHLGAEIIPLLQMREDSTDHQERAAIIYLLNNLKNPPKDHQKNELYTELQIPEITTIIPHPILDQRITILQWSSRRNLWLNRTR